jgi:nitroreductase
LPMPNDDPATSVHPHHHIRRDGLELLLARRSAPVLVEPAPSGAELETILHAATTVPDHGTLRPWRFVVVSGEARNRFGDALAASVKQARPETPVDALVKPRLKAFVAPLFVVIVFSPKDDGKTPEWEQMVSAGLTGYAMLLAAEALGLAAAWRSSHHLHGDALQVLLGMEGDERILGWINLGHMPEKVAAGLAVKPREPVPLDEVVTFLEP